jgi:thymidine kinase
MAKLYFYYSAMNAGKTTTLLQSAHNYHERGMRTLILTPRLDDRAGAAWWRRASACRRKA